MEKYFVYTAFCCLTSVMMPLSQFQDESPPVPIPLNHASSLAEPVGLPFFFLALTGPFLATPSGEGSGSARVGLTGGVCCGWTQAKEQRFLRILAVGLGERSRQRSSRPLIHWAASDCTRHKTPQRVNVNKERGTGREFKS